MIAHALSGSPCGHAHHDTHPDSIMFHAERSFFSSHASSSSASSSRHEFSRNGVLDILCQWRAQAQLQQITRQLAHSRRDDYRCWETLLTQHMQHAVGTHDIAALWKYARLLSAKHIGPHGRVYNAFPPVPPSLREWSDYLAKP
eukprot:349080-Heterocapsa_arctica.AAC.1